MADQEHVKMITRQSVATWNAWRDTSPTITPDLDGATLSSANLPANLRDADLHGAKLSGADLSDANLARADLTRADLSGATLIDAKLNGATLLGAKLRDAKLSGADLTKAILGETDFAGVDLCNVIGLATCDHLGPSIIDPVPKSRPLPLTFLQGVTAPRREADDKGT